MSSPILELIPAIHATIIGVIAAFFSAFAVFAFQKVQESKDKVDKILKDTELFDTPNNFVGGSSFNLLTQDGLLDWDKCRTRILREAKSMYSELDSKAKYNIDLGYRSNPSEEEISTMAKDLMLMLHYVFTTYPFNGQSIISTGDITEKIIEQKKRPFDIERLNELQSRISYLSWIWRYGHLSIIEIMKRYTAIQESKDRQQRDEEYKQMVDSLPDDSPEQYLDKVAKRINGHPNNINYVQLVTDYFEKVLQYEQRVIPVISEALLEYTRYNERFKVKRWSLKMLELVGFTLAIGVCLPITTLEILGGSKDLDWNGFWISWFELFVLSLSMSPYFYSCWYFYKKLKGLSFQ
ncbi:TPA: hypothetical protein ACVOZF_002313 [Vibrio diabolicus]|uniref:hypothetical protein n=1 Tax=Vibrio sp. ArtGut-C1 TaxID=2259137 RepID=UPI000A190176|nr:hypothetical protein [Vibrio sp. ArtGut-C1]